MSCVMLTLERPICSEMTLMGVPTEPRIVAVVRTATQTTYATEARSANGSGHHMEGSALDDRTAYGRCRDCGAELVISNGGEVTTRPDGHCTGRTR
jgi:hypothetical protein